jgi:hypothetical protein
MPPWGGSDAVSVPQNLARFCAKYLTIFLPKFMVSFQSDADGNIHRPDELTADGL